MNIETAPQITKTTESGTTSATKSVNNSSGDFASELNSLAQDESTTSQELPTEANKVENANNLTLEDTNPSEIQESNNQESNLQEPLSKQTPQDYYIETQMVIEPQKQLDKPLNEKIESEKFLTINHENQIENENNIKESMNGLQSALEEIKNAKRNKELTQTDEKNSISIKNKNIIDDSNIEIIDQENDNTNNQPPQKNNIKDIDSKKEDDILINNDINVQEPKEPLMHHMNADMNFNSDNQPFSTFVKQQEKDTLSNSEKDIEEENAILSTMNENIAIANQNRIMVQQAQPVNIDAQQKIVSINKQNPYTNEETQNNIIQSIEDDYGTIYNTETPKIKTVTDTEGIKKVDTKSNVTVETVVKFEEIAMNKNDVDFFVDLVNNGTQEILTQENLKSAQISKTLSDLIAKSMKDNQPIRIDFDNSISVIIKIGKDGKISADFLPGSQVAEAYLKENLPILRQKFDDNNIEYDELNQRKQKQDNKDDNRKKGRKDE